MESIASLVHRCVQVVLLVMLLELTALVTKQLVIIT